jgi:hypothetical protein
VHSRFYPKIAPFFGLNPKPQQSPRSHLFVEEAGLLLLCGWRKRRKRRDSSSSSDSTFQTQESHIAIVQGFNVCEEENFRVNSLVHFGLPP